MPFINGKFYMNPAYGRAIERARKANGIWSEQFPKFAESAVRGEDVWNDGSPGDAQQQSSVADSVTIDGRHVLIDETRGLQSPHGNQEHAKGHFNQADRRPGSKGARIIFNETSGLRPANKNPEDLHDARVAMAHTLLNAENMAHPPRTVTDILTARATRTILEDAEAKTAWADSQDALREAAGSTDDTNGAVHFLLDYPGLKPPSWATDDRETAHYGPFVNTAGGGDVPRGKVITIRIYTERPRY